MQHLEEQIAHLTRSVEEMSDVIARQQQEIDVLTRRVAMLMQREADPRAGRHRRCGLRRRTPAALLTPALQTTVFLDPTACPAQAVTGAFCDK